MKQALLEGTRVMAPDNDGVVKQGVVVDNLSVMCYIEFDDGTNTFTFKVDKNLREIT